jgi:hypothetical protein
MPQVPRNLQAGNKAFSGSFDNPFDAWPINGTNEVVEQSKAIPRIK